MVPSEVGDQFEGELDQALRLLVDEHRRHLLYLLREHGEMPIDDLSDVLAGWLAIRHDDGVATSDDREEIRLRLFHVHVPKLVAAGLAEFDEASDAVTLAELPPVVDRLLDEALELESGTRAESVATARSQGA